jgi:hypothetical protein
MSEGRRQTRTRGARVACGAHAATAGGVLALCALLAWPAGAQGRDPVAAEALFRAGREASKRGEHAAACPLFADSLRLDPTAGALLNLADCEERTGRSASAWQHYQRLLDVLPASDERLVFARLRIEALQGRLARIVLTLAAGAPEGTRVLRDGAELGQGALGLALPVDPGLHVIEVLSPGRPPARNSIQATEGSTEALPVAPGDPEAPSAPSASSASSARSPAGPAAASSAAGAAPPGGGPGAGDGAGATPADQPRPAHAPGPTPRRIAGLALGGVGLASLLVGVVTGVMVVGKRIVVYEHCDANACDEDGLDAAVSGKRLSTLSTYTFFGGAVAAGAGAYLLLAAGPRGETASMGIYPGRSGGTLLLRGSFLPLGSRPPGSDPRARGGRAGVLVRPGGGRRFRREIPEDPGLRRRQTCRWRGLRRGRSGGRHV